MNSDEYDRPEPFEKPTVLVLFHDAPEAEGDPFAKTQKMDLHKIRIVSTVSLCTISSDSSIQIDHGKLYIDWAFRHDIAIVDVNTPRFLTGIDSDSAFITEAQKREKLSQSVSEVADYL